MFLPECCDFVGTNRDETIALSEPLTGPTVQFYQGLAKSNDIWLSLGGIHEAIYNKVSRNGHSNRESFLVTNSHSQSGEHSWRIHNSHVVINSGGELVAVYRKLHLFDVQTADFKFRESETVDSGNNIVAPLTSTPLGGGLGLLIVTITSGFFSSPSFSPNSIRSATTCVSPR